MRPGRRFAGGEGRKGAASLRGQPLSRIARKSNVARRPTSANKEKAAQDGAAANALAAAQAAAVARGDAPGQGHHHAAVERARGGPGSSRRPTTAPASRGVGARQALARRPLPLHRGWPRRRPDAVVDWPCSAWSAVGIRRRSTSMRRSRSKRRRPRGSTLARVRSRGQGPVPSRSGCAGIRRPAALSSATPNPRAPLASFSGFLRRRRAALRHDLVLPVPRAEPADLLLAAQGAALLHAAHPRPVRRRARARLSRALLRPLRRHAPRGRRRVGVVPLPAAGHRTDPAHQSRRALHRARAQSADDAAVVSPADAVPAAGGRAGFRARVGARADAGARAARAAALPRPSSPALQQGRAAGRAGGAALRHRGTGALARHRVRRPRGRSLARLPARPRIPRRRLRRPDAFRVRGTKAGCTGIAGCSGCCSCPPCAAAR